MHLVKAIQPTFYFIGVTTTKSSIMKLFPIWAKVLGLNDTVIRGIDIELHANPEAYREVVRFLKQDELSLGALVTTHKIDLFQAAEDLFDEWDPYAVRFRELSCISKRQGKLWGHAKDPISSGLALEAFVPRSYWNQFGGEVFIMGAGGSALAITSYLLHEKHRTNVPRKIYVSDLSEQRLASMRNLLSGNNPDRIPIEYRLSEQPEDNDRILYALPPYSLVINATGMGKDRPGSPLTDNSLFPDSSLVWELNYRGDLLFMKQAHNQMSDGRLHVENGWKYFIHGWTQVIGEVFHVEMDGQTIAALESIANEQT